jgi:hypothetical protein
LQKVCSFYVDARFKISSEHFVSESILKFSFNFAVVRRSVAILHIITMCLGILGIIIIRTKFRLQKYAGKGKQGANVMITFFGDFNQFLAILTYFR